jgi:NAD(P) transhydrogenase subunit alpha
MTAAGTVKPARAVIFGAGVAGLQAIATARRLGCIVEATDVRMAAKEQVESLGGKFIDVPGMEDLEDEGGYAKEASPEFLRRQKEEVNKRVAAADFVVTTALIPGRPAPRLVDEATVKTMKRGSVIVDLAVESGGNCELSVPGEVVERHGVTLVGLRNLPATVPFDASGLYGKNVLSLIQLMFDKEKRFAMNLEDEVLAGCLLTHGGELVHEATRARLQATESPA